MTSLPVLLRGNSTGDDLTGGDTVATSLPVLIIGVSTVGAPVASPSGNPSSEMVIIFMIRNEGLLLAT